MDIVPPLRFGTVEEGLYRGAYPLLRNFNYLRRLKIKTIVSLIPEEPTKDLKAFCKAEGITNKWVEADRFKGEPQLLHADLSSVLAVLLNAEAYPVYLHCLDGRQTTGMCVMALRKVMCWDYQSLYDEFLRYAKEAGNELAFIVDYPADLQAPPKLPRWLWPSFSDGYAPGNKLPAFPTPEARQQVLAMAQSLSSPNANGRGGIGFADGSISSSMVPSPAKGTSAPIVPTSIKASAITQAPTQYTPPPLDYLITDQVTKAKKHPLLRITFPVQSREHLMGGRGGVVGVGGGAAGSGNVAGSSASQAKVPVTNVGELTIGQGGAAGGDSSVSSVKALGATAGGGAGSGRNTASSSPNEGFGSDGYATSTASMGAVAGRGGYNPADPSTAVGAAITAHLTGTSLEHAREGGLQLCRYFIDVDDLDPIARRHPEGDCDPNKTRERIMTAYILSVDIATQGNPSTDKQQQQGGANPLRSGGKVTSFLGGGPLGNTTNTSRGIPASPDRAGSFGGNNPLASTTASVARNDAFGISNVGSVASLRELATPAPTTTTTTAAPIVDNCERSVNEGSEDATRAASPASPTPSEKDTRDREGAASVGMAMGALVAGAGGAKDSGVAQPGMGSRVGSASIRPTGDGQQPPAPPSPAAVHIPATTTRMQQQYTLANPIRSTTINFDDPPLPSQKADVLFKSRAVSTSLAGTTATRTLPTYGYSGRASCCDHLDTWKRLDAPDSIFYLSLRTTMLHPEALKASAEHAMERERGCGFGHIHSGCGKLLAGGGSRNNSSNSMKQQHAGGNSNSGAKNDKSAANATKSPHRSGPSTPTVPKPTGATAMGGRSRSGSTTHGPNATAGGGGSAAKRGGSMNPLSEESSSTNAGRTTVNKGHDSAYSVGEDWCAAHARVAPLFCHFRHTPSAARYFRGDESDKQWLRRSASR